MISRQQKMLVAVTMMAGYAKLQELERKRQVPNGTTGIFTPLSGDKQALYERLRKWWNDIGVDKQLKIEEMTREFIREDLEQLSLLM